MKNLSSERINETRFNKNGLEMCIIEYTNERNIIVKFLSSGRTVSSRYSHFLDGSIKDRYANFVFGKGYIGIGKYKSSNNKKTTKMFNAWKGMLRRSYDNSEKENPSYLGCSVAEEWHNFQNFGKWYDENYYEVDNEEMTLDKDILVKGNKIYSSKTCIFVPKNINMLFTQKRRFRGNYPIGVHFHKQNKKYIAQCNKNSKEIYLGCFVTPELAFNTYKIYKENLIKQIADQYKDKIPQKLYDSMYKYIVEIND
ncbi:MAG TPA: hypothetical protein VIM42_02605 [Clostridium sp.]